MNWKWLNKGISLAECVESVQKNNFTLIRLLAALLVVETHSHFFTGTDPFPNERFRISFLGLPSFFFLSGLLVTQSLYKSKSAKNFLWKRMLRLYPAACLSILSCALILGPLVTTLSMSDYFSSPILYRFLCNCALLRLHFNLPGVFEHSVMGPGVNGSLWSVALELKLYVGLLLVWLLRIPAKRYLLMALIVTLICCGYFFSETAEAMLRKVTGHDFHLYIYFTYAPLFLIGVLCAVFRDKIMIRNYWILLVILSVPASVYCNCYDLAAFVILPAGILYMATNGVRWLKKITPKADLSYGIYVFAFPVQQVVVNYLHPANPVVMFVLSVLIVLPFAMLSWFGIEQQALNLKDWVK